MLIVSFYTADWEYPAHGARLRKECDALGLRHRIEELPSRRSYLQNCCLKPAYIQRCLEDAKEPVLWVDVDGSIFRSPDFFSDADLYDFQAKRITSPKRTRVWHVGTMWWNYTDASRDFIARWVANTGASTDESAIEATWREGHALRHRDIPQSYFEILRDGLPPKPGTVIGHRLSKGESKKVECPLAEKYEREVL